MPELVNDALCACMMRANLVKGHLDTPPVRAFVSILYNVPVLSQIVSLDALAELT